MRISLTLLLIAALVGTPSAHAQLRLPESESRLEFPARARAVRPTGITAHRLTWEGAHYVLPRSDGSSGVEMAGLQLAAHSAHAAVPFESAVFVLDMVGLAHWLIPDVDDQFVTLITGNLELGADFADAPVEEVRYRIGGAVALPTETLTTVDDIDSMSPRSLSAFSIANLLRVRSLGWNAHRLSSDTITLIARAHVEVDPHPNLALALHVDVPVSVAFDGAVDVRPQAALTVAGRIDGIHLVGVRTEVVTNLAVGDHTRDANVLVEPFARVALSIEDDVAVWFMRLALRAPLGPAFTFIGDEPVGWLGASVEIGALY